jgi:hypothetical protein
VIRIEATIAPTRKSSIEVTRAYFTISATAYAPTPK